jgi:membrane protease YdiL (CAAX protease family)
MDAPSLGVLRDTALLVWIALLFGVIAYQLLRTFMPDAMTSIGRVQVADFVSGDAIIVAALSLLFLSGMQASTGGAESAKEPLELTLDGLLGSIVVQFAICVMLLLYLQGLRNLSPAELFGLRRIKLRYVGIIALLAMIPTLMLVNGSALAIQNWMEGFWPDLSGQDTAEAFRKAKDPLAKLLLIISAAIVAPLVEEIVFRGFIYGVIKRYTDGIFAALCSSLLFAAIHLHVGTLMPLAILAMVFCAMYELTGCLLVPMVMHGLFNATSLTVLLFFPDIQP